MWDRDWQTRGKQQEKQKDTRIARAPHVADLWRA
jgi:hypothetical protein